MKAAGLEASGVKEQEQDAWPQGDSVEATIIHGTTSVQDAHTSLVTVIRHASANKPGVGHEDCYGWVRMVTGTNPRC